MYNTLMIIFWTLTYFLIALNGFIYRKEKLVFMPLIAGGLNFAWEINALIHSDGYWGHIVWLCVDIVIILQNIYFLSSVKRRIIYSLLVVIFTLSLSLFFRVKLFDGMLISSFVIDLVMAIEYILFAKKLSPHLKSIIGIMRFLGDFFAWIMYFRVSVTVCVIGTAVTIINLLYICYCFRIENKYDKN